MKRLDMQQELNEALTSLSSFAEAYNKTLPLGFPRASVQVLEQFQATHPLLFRKGDEWSIVRHRKRVMDWLSSHRNAF